MYREQIIYRNEVSNTQDKIKVSYALFENIMIKDGVKLERVGIKIITSAENDDICEYSVIESRHLKKETAREILETLYINAVLPSHLHDIISDKYEYVI